MSVKVMGAVWANSQHKGSELLLLLAIADNANDEGVAWPSQETLAAKMRMSVRQVRRLSHTLEDAGAVEVTSKRVGSKTHLIYTLNVPGGQDVRPQVEVEADIYAFRPDIAMSAEPSIEPSEDQEQDLRPIAAVAAREHRNEIWDALADIFGDPLTKSAKALRGKVVSSLLEAGATADQVWAAPQAYRERMPAGTTLTETALEKHWSLLSVPVEVVVGRNTKYGQRDVSEQELLDLAARLQAEDEKKQLAPG